MFIQLQEKVNLYIKLIQQFEILVLGLGAVSVQIVTQEEIIDKTTG